MIRSLKNLSLREQKIYNKFLDENHSVKRDEIWNECEQRIYISLDEEQREMFEMIKRLWQEEKLYVVDLIRFVSNYQKNK